MGRSRICSNRNGGSDGGLRAASIVAIVGGRPGRDDNGEIGGEGRGLVPDGVDRVLDLVGNSVLRDSMRAVRVNGRICQAGFLGGLGPLDEFQPVFDMPSGVQFSFFGSFEVGTDAFPLAAIPLQQMVRKVEAGHYKASPSRVFAFEEIAEAHRVMERGEALGKLVVAAA